VCVYRGVHVCVVYVYEFVCNTVSHSIRVYLIISPLAITEIIQDLHQRIDAIKTIVTSLPLSDPAKLVYAVHQITKEVGISKSTHQCTPVHIVTSLTFCDMLKVICPYQLIVKSLSVMQSEIAAEFLFTRWQDSSYCRKYYDKDGGCNRQIQTVE